MQWVTWLLVRFCPSVDVLMTLLCVKPSIMMLRPIMVSVGLLKRPWARLPSGMRKATQLEVVHSLVRSLVPIMLEDSRYVFLIATRGLKLKMCTLSVCLVPVIPMLTVLSLMMLSMCLVSLALVKWVPLCLTVPLVLGVLPSALANLKVLVRPCVVTSTLVTISLPIVPVPVFGEPKIGTLCCDTLVIGTPPALVFVWLIVPSDGGTLSRRRLVEWISSMLGLPRLPVIVQALRGKWSSLAPETPPRARTPHMVGLVGGGRARGL